MPLVYFDTNIFDQILKKRCGVGDSDERKLRAALSSERLLIAASHVTIRETIATLHSSPENARAQFGLIESFIDWDRFLKFHSEILEAARYR